MKRIIFPSIRVYYSIQPHWNFSYLISIILRNWDQRCPFNWWVFIYNFTLYYFMWNKYLKYTHQFFKYQNIGTHAKHTVECFLHPKHWTKPVWKYSDTLANCQLVFCTFFDIFPKFYSSKSKARLYGKSSAQTRVLHCTPFVCSIVVLHLSVLDFV